MARIRDAKLDTPTARGKLSPRRKPYWVRVAPTVWLGYRAAKRKPGTWSVGGDARRWIRKFGFADDVEKADNKHIFSFWEAQQRAKELARGQTTEGQGAPVTVSQALDNYRADLLAHGAHASNADRIRTHLSHTLASKCVAILSVGDLRQFRDGLAEKNLKPGSINRCTKALKAALNAAADADTRITNRSSWRIGLKLLPTGNAARRLVLPDEDIRRIVAAAHAIDRPLGLLCEVLAVTGCRASQAARLTVSDLQIKQERLLMAPSRKGGRRAAAKKPEHIPLPIPGALVQSLQQAVRGRADDAALLLQGDGQPWQSRDLTKPFAVAAARAGLPASTTSYCMRHSSIVRMILRSLPISLISRLHDTSAQQIETNYARYITDVADDLARTALLDMRPNVVPITAKRRRKA
jgi:integrase